MTQLIEPAKFTEATTLVEVVFFGPKFSRSTYTKQIINISSL